MTEDPHRFTQDAWEANAQVWDERMGDNGNDFFNVLCWPAMESLLGESASAGRHVLDIACGNGLTSRRLADRGARVTAFDFSKNLIDKARIRSSALRSQIEYHVMDATDEAALLALGEQTFDAALSNMALFDIADIEPLFRALPRLLKPRGIFVFSLTHPAFNNASTVRAAEQVDDEGEVRTQYSVRISRYMTTYHARGVALRDQAVPQMYFERPLHYYLNLGFRNGFVLDGFAERAFPPEHVEGSPLGWSGRFSEIPPVLVARFRLAT